MCVRVSVLLVHLSFFLSFSFSRVVNLTNQFFKAHLAVPGWVFEGREGAAKTKIPSRFLLMTQSLPI